MSEALKCLPHQGDTCGVHNLHGMPAILGGLVAGLAGLAPDNADFIMRTGEPKLQLGYQVLAMVVTMVIAISSEYPSPFSISVFITS